MAEELEGEDVSLWVATTPETTYPQLRDDHTVYDVVIVGGGITGVATAQEMLRRGMSVALIERGNLVEWTTGGTTAKLSSQHYLIYDHLLTRQGRDTARAFGAANERGITKVETLSNQLGIDCGFARRDAYVFTRTGEKIEEMRAEVEAAQAIGLPATFETEIDLPFDIAGAVRFSHQAQFHPRKFLLGLARHVTDGGGVIYERTNATGLTAGDPNTVHTEHGDLRAKKIVQASGEPFWGAEAFEGFMWLKMSYALGVTLASGEYPRSMYITTDTPMRTIRTAEYNGEPIMIFGGESHEYDDAAYDEGLRYRNLIDDVRERFDVEKVHFRWLAGDFMPYDRMPFIGTLPGHGDVYVATGYRAWGLAWAMSAAEAIAADAAGEPVDWVRAFSTERLAHPIPESERVHGL